MLTCVLWLHRLKKKNTKWLPCLFIEMQHCKICWNFLTILWPATCHRFRDSSSNCRVSRGRLISMSVTDTSAGQCPSTVHRHFCRAMSIYCSQTLLQGNVHLLFQCEADNITWKRVQPEMLFQLYTWGQQTEIRRGFKSSYYSVDNDWSLNQTYKINIPL